MTLAEAVDMAAARPRELLGLPARRLERGYPADLVLFEWKEGEAVRVTRTVLPTDLPYGPMVGTVFGAEGATIFAELIDSGRVDELVDRRQAAGLKAGAEIRARDYLQAQRLRTVLIDRFRELFESVDVIVGPGRTSTAPAIDAPLDGRPPGAGSLATTPKADAPGPGNTGLIPAGNLAGLPAIFFPCGFGSDGLPVGLQIVGPPFSEPLLVAIVSAYQRATGHHLRRPKDPAAPEGRGPNRPT